MYSLFTKNRTLSLSLIGIIGFLVLVYLLHVDAKLASAILVSLLVAINVYMRPKHYALPFFIAVMFAIFITTVHHYEYDTVNFYLGPMNIFPLVLWTGGLLLTREIYLLLPGRYKLVSALFLYWVILAALEYIGRYWVGIRLDESIYPSLLGSGILHGTPVMHVFYPAAGPLFLIITVLVARYTPWLKA